MILHVRRTPRLESADTFAGEVPPPAGAAFRWDGSAAAPSGPGASFGAEVSSARSFWLAGALAGRRYGPAVGDRQAVTLPFAIAIM